ncbi:hypothetical protein GDO86_003455 [Hymenochirus boettgeri]|uniref:Fork-head domain-containing protein n=1 Tax=Hymenochirus boettgeri TaxID=247094 RepID=A0A8T2K1H7_9PIPI|nr:hypothetical protein GDO86_003455 [Hymenochirus boettgeri]
MEKLETESDVEPQGRPRSCTWPPLPEPPSDLPLQPPGLDPGQMRKAKSSRRNAWGNLSYANLITKAIESSPERRLTLSQIYDWMFRFVPYFKDKGDSNSSAGWKNSIRHNLSLHTRFIRVQNEGTGKSSWWMLNPEGGKTGKTPRRRTASLDNANGKFLRIKGKTGKKKQQQIQSAPERTVEDSPSSQHAKWSESPSSHTSDDFDVWADFHSRSNHATSTISGRLSPIMANNEPDDLEDDDVAPSSPLMYPSPSSALSPSTRCSVEMPRLAELSGTAGLGEGLSDHLLDELQDGYSVGSGAALRQRSTGFFSTKCPTLSPPSGAYCGSIYSQSAIGMRRLPMQTIQENKQAAFSPGSAYRHSSVQDILSAMSYGHKEGLGQSDPGMANVLGQQRNHRQNIGMLGNCDSGPMPYSTSMMKSHSLFHQPSLNHHCSVNNSALISASGLMSNSESCSLASAQHHPYFSSQSGNGSLMESPYQATYHHHLHHHHHPQMYNQDRFPTDLDLDMFNGTLECDVESIILNDFMDSDEMDFNFDSSLPPQNGFNMAVTSQPANQSWVQG